MDSALSNIPQSGQLDKFLQHCYQSSNVQAVFNKNKRVIHQVLYCSTAYDRISSMTGGKYFQSTNRIYMKLAYNFKVRLMGLRILQIQALLQLLSTRRHPLLCQLRMSSRQPELLIMEGRHSKIALGCIQTLC